MKNIVVLGSTGNLGTQTLELLRKYKNDFKLVGISANTSEELLNEQTEEFGIDSENTILTSRDGQEKLLQLAASAEIIVNVLSGTAGIEPSFAALEAGKTLLLANKETVVASGHLLHKYLPQIIPLDSEHNAIHEILKANPGRTPLSITLPCSGGPLLNHSPAQLENITVDEVLAHPRWDMGPKVTVESATLINKGLEVIEAHYLFDLPLEKIKVVIHPECKIHGVVEFATTPDKPAETLAYVSPPDMREHIENGLLETLGQSTSRNITPLADLPYDLSMPIPPHLPGITIVTGAFKKDPLKMREFLAAEEEVIAGFLEGRHGFRDLILQDSFNNRD